MPAPDQAPVPEQGSSSAPAHRPPRIGLRVAAVVVALLLLAGLVVAGVRASDPPSAASPLDRYFPLAVGTTWVFEVREGEEEPRVEVTQVIGTGLLPDQPGAPTVAVVETRAEEPEPTAEVAYFARRGRSVVRVASRDDGVFNDTVPDEPVLRLPFEPGASWTWSGEAFGLEVASQTTRVTGVEDLELAGAELSGCLRTSTGSEIQSGGSMFAVSTESWTCPGVGTVRAITDAPDLGFHREQELLAFATVDRSVGDEALLLADREAASAASEAAGGGPGLDPGRSNALEDEPDLTAPAWTDHRAGDPAGPPVGADGVMVLGEEDGTVSATDTVTGTVRWRVRVQGRVLAPPVIAGPVVLVVDAGKTVTALDLRTGRTWWRRTFPDLASGPAMAAEGLALVAFHDRAIRALRLHDGSTAWERSTGGIVHTPLARTGDVVVASDDGGSVLGLDLRDGDDRWEVELGVPSEGGPAARGDQVVVVDGFAVVTSIDAGSGEIRWTHSLPSLAELPPAVGPDAVVALVDDGSLFALDPEDGRAIWEAETGAEGENAPVIAGSEVLVLSEDVRLHRFALGDGRRLGTVPVPSLGDRSFADSEVDLAAFDGALVATVDADEPWPNAIVAFSLGPDGPTGATFDGRRRTVYPPLDPRGPRDVPAIDDGSLIVPAFGDDLWSVPMERDGEIRPLLRGEGQEMPFVVEARETLLVQRGNRLLALPRAGGPERWSFPMGEPFPTVRPAVAGDRVVVPVGGGGLAALDLATGEVRWQRGDTGNGLGRSTPIVVGDVAVHAVGGFAGYDLDTGEPRWRIDGVIAFSPLAATGGTVYAGVVSETDGFLLAVDAATGAERWRAPMLTAVFIGPAASSDAVVAVDDAGVARAFDPATGEERWTFRLRTRPTGTPVILGDVVVLAEEGRTEDLREREYRIVLLDLASGRYLASYEPAGSGARLPAFGEADGRLVAYDSGDLLLLEVQR